MSEHQCDKETAQEVAEYVAHLEAQIIEVTTELTRYHEALVFIRDRSAEVCGAPNCDCSWCVAAAALRQQDPKKKGKIND